MHSSRFDLPIVFAHHARARMAARKVSETPVQSIVDTGTVKLAGPDHYWLYQEVHGRTDNLLCVAAVIDNAVVVRTILHHWELQA